MIEVTYVVGRLGTGGGAYPVSHLREQASSVLITGTDGDDFQPRG